LRGRSATLDLQLQRRTRRQRLRQPRADDRVADLERDHAVGRLAEDQRLEHLPRLEQRRIGRGGASDDLGQLGLDRGNHRPTLPDSG
jgi:hypothetical protein